MRHVTVFALKPTNPISQQQFIQRYPKVLKEGVGKIVGNYQIRLKSNVIPVQHVPSSSGTSAAAQGNLEQYGES